MNKLYYSCEQFYINYKWVLEKEDKKYWLHLIGQKQEVTSMIQMIDKNYLLVLKYDVS